MIIKLIIACGKLIIACVERCFEPAEKVQEEGRCNNVRRNVPTNYGSVRVNPPPPPNRQPTLVQPTGARTTKKV